MPRIGTRRNFPAQTTIDPRGTAIATPEVGQSVAGSGVTPMRRKITEIVMSIGAVGLLLLVLVSFDDRVRHEFSMRWDRGPAVQATEFGQTAKSLGGVVVQAARDQ